MQRLSFGEFLNQPYNVSQSSKSICPSFETGVSPDHAHHLNIVSLRTSMLRKHIHFGKVFSPWFTKIRLEDLWCAADPVAWLRSKLASFCFAWKEANIRVEMDAREWLMAPFNTSQKLKDSWFFNSNRVCEDEAEARAQVSVVNNLVHPALEQYVGYNLISC